MENEIPHDYFVPSNIPVTGCWQIFNFFDPGYWGQNTFFLSLPKLWLFLKKFYFKSIKCTFCDFSCSIIQIPNQDGCMAFVSKVKNLQIAKVFCFFLIFGPIWLQYHYLVVLLLNFIAKNYCFTLLLSITISQHYPSIDSSSA